MRFNLARPNTKPRRDHTGERYGALTVLGVAEEGTGNMRKYHCRWECCGRERTYAQSSLNTEAANPRAQCGHCKQASAGTETVDEAPKAEAPRNISAPGWGNPPVLGGWNQNAVREIDRRWAK